MTPDNQPSKIFISYSHKDKKFLDELKPHLTFYSRSSQLTLWDDTTISPGMKWQDEIDAAISESQIFILLVSADFLASEFIMQHELPALLKNAESKGRLVLSVIVRPSAFADTALSAFQAINNPDKPLSGLSKHERDKV